MSVILSDRLKLVARTPSPNRWLLDQEIVRFSELRGKKHSQKECDAYAYNHDMVDDFQWGIFVRGGLVSNTVGVEHIGSITVNVDPQNRVAQMGILLGEKQHWGKGYGTEAWRTIMSYLFQNHRLHKIEAGCMAVNIGMIHILDSCGFILEGKITDHFLWEGQRVDMYRYGKLKVEDR